MDAETRTGWLAVIYKLPSKPSTLRVNVWRQVKELGGLSLQQSTYAFPDTPETRIGLAQLRRQVEDGGGEATLLEVPALDADKERSFIEELRRLRDEEYGEIAEDCEELIHRLARKTERGHFDLEETRDAQADLARVREHFGAILARDYFGGGRQPATQELVARTASALARYGERVAEVCGTEGEPGPLAAAPASGKRVREQSHQTHPMTQAIAHAREALDAFARGDLVIGSTPVEHAEGTALLELKYSDRNGKRCLEVEIEW